MALRPFFNYYGGKYRLSARLPSPRYGRIVEAFAGSAGYAVRHPSADVLLIDTNPVIIGVWDFLIRAKPSEVLALPDVGGGSVDDLPVCQEARWLIGFWLNKGTSAPVKKPSAWMRSGRYPRQFWGPEIRERLARQVERIRHWKTLLCSYAEAPDIEATWIVDPPYQRAGVHYTHNNVDFEHLAAWVHTRRGLVFVHEAEGATWLPFQPFAEIKAMEGGHGKKTSKEALYIID